MTHPIKRILVGVDGSDNSQRALEWAITLAGPFRAEVIAVHAVGLLARLDGGTPVPSHPHRDELQATFESVWCAPLARSDVAYRTLCVDGPPVLAVLNAASEEEADLIVLGRRGSGGFTELMLGSTSHQVAEHSSCPVFIVPPPRV